MKLTGRIVISAMLVAALSSCHIYKKYELPEDNAVINQYRKALEAPVDSSSLGNLGWEQTFTDPQLQTLIRTALANNKDLDNARLNVEIEPSSVISPRWHLPPTAEPLLMAARI